MYNREELESKYSGISASSLDWFDISPLYFKKKLDKQIADIPSKEMELGSQLHMYILEHEKFKKEYLYENFDKPRGDKQKEFCEVCASLKKNNDSLKALDIAIPAYKTTYLTDKKSEEKIKEEALTLYKSMQDYINYLSIQHKYKGTISNTNYVFLRTVKNVIEKHSLAKQLLFSGTDSFIDNPNEFIENELLIYWEHPTIQFKNTPLVLKSFIDRLRIDFSNKVIQLIDIKTCNRLYEFTDKVKSRKYNRQMACYWRAVEYYFTQTWPELNFTDFKQETYLVGVQTPNIYINLPTECRVVRLSEETMLEGLDNLDRTLQELMWHFNNDSWDYSIFHHLHNGIDLVI